jgi:hypothetical protein
VKPVASAPKPKTVKALLADAIQAPVTSQKSRIALRATLRKLRILETEESAAMGTQATTSAEEAPEAARRRAG